MLSMWENSKIHRHMVVKGHGLVLCNNLHLTHGRTLCFGHWKNIASWCCCRNWLWSKTAIILLSGCGKTDFVKNVLETVNMWWMYYLITMHGSTLCFNTCPQKNTKIKFIEELPDSFKDENQNHLIILEGVIFQASDHPEVVRIFT